MITLSPILQASRNKFGIKIDLKSSLDAGAKAFIQYRYAYEGEALSGYGLGNLSEVLCNVIAIDKPEWGPTFDWPPLPDINWSNDRGM